MKERGKCYLCKKEEEGKKYTFHYGEIIGQSDYKTIHTYDRTETSYIEHYSSIRKKTVFICRKCYMRNLWRHVIAVWGYKNMSDNEFEAQGFGVLPSLYIGIICAGIAMFIDNRFLLFILIGAAIICGLFLIFSLLGIFEFGPRLAIYNWMKRPDKNRDSIPAYKLKIWRTPSSFKGVVKKK